MTYELAKQLKEAGFPEITRIGRELNLHRYLFMDMDAVSFPFLQELLAELPTAILWKNTLYRRHEQNSDLPRQEQVWIATSQEGWLSGSITEVENSLRDLYVTGYLDDSFNKTCYGKTPEEAVAKLWLALHT